ncbi:MAG TPA: prolyl oligopeptidase family serine peptidase [Terriglobales bacterium]|nr:prolyl oligopeptidase family serine peptidase [Terriglobales bacterium]
MAAHAQFTIEQVMTYPFPSNLTASATGERVAWAVNFKGIRNVWIADGPSFRAQQVTHYAADDGGEIDSVRLTPDGKTVLYSRGSETNQQGEVADPTSNINRPLQQVWAVTVGVDSEPRLLGEMGCGQEDCEDIEISPDGQFAVWSARRQIWIAPIAGGTGEPSSAPSGDMRGGRMAAAAGPAKSIGYVRGDNESPKWSPDSKMIAFVSRRGDHSFIGIYDRAEDTIRWIAPTFDRDAMPRWSPDGTMVAFIRHAGAEMKMPMIPLRPDPWSIWIGNPQTGEAHRIWQSGTEMNDSLPRTENESFYFAAGNRLVFGYEPEGWNHLYTISTGGGQPMLLTPGQFDIEDVSLTPDRQTVIYTSNEASMDPVDVDRRHIWAVPAAGGQRQRAITRGEPSEWAPVATGDGKFLVCLGSTGTTPGMAYYLSGNMAQGGMQRNVIAGDSLPREFPSAQLVNPKQVIFKAEDGVTIHGQLFVPKNAAGRRPAILFMHGGSKRQMLLAFHYMNYYSNAYAMNEYLASKGYVVLSVNYRTGIMYGRAFSDPPDGGWRGASEYKDIVAAGRYLQSLPNVDPEKVGLWGGSYGGFLTAMGLAHNSDIFKAGVDLHGVHDWSVRQNRIGSGNDAPDEKEAIELAYKSSPNYAISTWRSPVLLIQGDDDRNVQFSQSVDLAQRLKAQGVPFEQIVYPDEIHDFLLWRDWVHAYDAGEKFFDRVLVQGEKLAPAK